MDAKHTRREAVWLTFGGGLLVPSESLHGAVTSATILKRVRKFRWVEMQTGGIDLSIEVGSRAEREVEDVKRRLALAQEKVEQVLGERLRPRVRVFIAGSVATSKGLMDTR